MTTLVPRDPYSQEELDKLYPKSLELQLVQVASFPQDRLTNSRREIARICSVSKCRFGTILAILQCCETAVFGRHDIDGLVTMELITMEKTLGEIWGRRWPRNSTWTTRQLGELTDKGRETTLSLGTRLRHLYVNQLHFMPKLIASADMIYLRATPMPRALESVQQTFWGMYPLTARTASFPPPTIVTRTPADETLFPNDSNCRRFNQLSRAFAQRTADRWNESDQVAYLNKLISKWMPDSSPHVAVDSHPRLSGIMDTINSTLAHGPETRLPSEFYDPKLRSIIDKIGVEEWFSGYAENREYRALGIGALVGDILERMSASIEHTGLSVNEIGGEDGNLGHGRDGETCIKFAMSGCHDTTLAAILTSLGAFDGRSWPPYTSHLAIEMFRRKDLQPADSRLEAQTSSFSTSQRPGLFSSFRRTIAPTTALSKTNISRRPYATLTAAERQRLEGFYVRMRYNDEPVTIPGCASPGNHLDGDETFCTLDAFKRIVDGFVPRDWKKECQANMNGVIKGVGMGAPEEKAGWETDSGD